MKYDYKCNSESCGVIFEVNHSMSFDGDVVCPACEKLTHEKVITGGTGFLLKGTGWASDLYSSKK